MGLGRGVQLKLSLNSMGKLKCDVCANVANVIVTKCEGFFFLLLSLLFFFKCQRAMSHIIIIES